MDDEFEQMEAAGEGIAKAADAALSAKLQDDFAQTFYNEINKIIGSKSSEEKLCLLLPGIELNQSDYAYDYENGYPKGPVVEANESALVDKLYDPFDLVGADNGKTLSRQYRSALDILTPKLNAAIAKSKNKLRELLMKPFPYTFKDENGVAIDENKSYTFQEVYFRLYEEYVQQQSAWANLRNDARTRITNEVNANDKIPAEKKAREIENRYLQWYEDIAESEISKVNKKMSTLLAVFSATDMKILEGILDSGSGAELQEARQTLNNVRKINPNGGYTYPVKLYPTDWFKKLDTSFTPMDLLSSPSVMMEELQLYYGRRAALERKILAVASAIPESAEVQEKAKEITEAKEKLDQAEVAFDESMGDGFSDFAKYLTTSICNAVCAPIPANANEEQRTEAKKDNQKVLEKTLDKNSDAINEKGKKELEAKAEEAQKAADNAEEKDKVGLQQKATDLKNKAATLNPAGIINGAIDSVFKACNDVASKQADVTSKLQALGKTMLDYLSSKQKLELKKTVEMLQDQSEAIEAKIKTLESKVGLSATTDKEVSMDTNPPSVPEGFSQITIVHNVSHSESSSRDETTFSREKKTSGFWIFKKQTTEETSTSKTQALSECDGTEIRIGLNVAKVTFEREWFNPGVFALTKEMYSLANKGTRISHGFEAGVSNSVNDILPCYPTAMVIARDVTIKITNTGEALASSFSSVSEETTKSRGYFVFSGNDVQSSTTENSATASQYDDKSVTMRFSTPQVIGFYLHSIPEDNSTPYAEENDSDLTTIFSFVKTYEELIDAKIKAQTAGK